MADSIGWGLIGASTIAREWVIGAIRATPGNRVAALFSRSRERGAAFAAAAGIDRSYDRLDAFLADPGIDAVYIASTNERHHPEVLACAAAGKHVLCEKPMALSIDEALAMIAACEKAGTVLAINHHLRGAAPHRAMRDIVASGSLGGLVAVRMAHGGLLPAGLQTWRLKDPATGAGAVLDLTVHDADLARFLLGEDLVEAAAMTRNSGLAAGAIEDTAHCVLRSRSGVLVQFQDVFNTPFNRTSVEIHGTAGSLFGSDCMTQTARGDVLLRDAAGERLLPMAHENLYVRVLRQFNDAVAGRGAPGCPGRDGLASLATALAVRDAARLGQTVAVDPRALAAARASAMKLS